MNLSSPAFTLLEPVWLWGLLAVLALAAIIGVALLVARARLRTYFAAASGARVHALQHTARGVLRLVLVTASLSLAVLALARPAGNPTPVPAERTGRDVVFAIDVSRSMLAEDLRPSRLERAKLAVSDVLDTVEGDRVAIVAFAGAAVVRCPLTTDYAFARMALEDLSPDSVSIGGTAIGTAIASASSLFFADADPAQPTPPTRSRTLFIITDGEDHEAAAKDRAKAVGDRGVRIVTIGLGSDISGAPVPAPKDNSRVAGNAGYINYKGTTVQSRMNPESLRTIAEQTPGGVFLNVGVGNVELDSVYKRLMANQAREKLDDTTMLRYAEYFQIPLAAALALLAMEGLTHVRVRRA